MHSNEGLRFDSNILSTHFRFIYFHRVWRAISVSFDEWQNFWTFEFFVCKKTCARARLQYHQSIYIILFSHKYKCFSSIYQINSISIAKRLLHADVENCILHTVRFKMHATNWIFNDDVLESQRLEFSSLNCVLISFLSIIHIST